MAPVDRIVPTSVRTRRFQILIAASSCACESALISSAASSIRSSPRADCGTQRPGLPQRAATLVIARKAWDVAKKLGRHLTPSAAWSRMTALPGDHRFPRALPRRTYSHPTITIPLSAMTSLTFLEQQKFGCVEICAPQQRLAGSSRGAGMAPASTRLSSRSLRCSCFARFGGAGSLKPLWQPLRPTFPKGAVPRSFPLLRRSGR